MQLLEIALRNTTDALICQGNEESLQVNDRVLVSTDHGPVIGTIRRIKDTPQSPPTSLKLHALLRRASSEDLRRAEVLQKQEDLAFAFCRERIVANQMQMKLIRTHALFDGQKIVFYFAAEGRIDFRFLVRDLAREFRLRIEMRQIGVRDSAKMIGGLGPCGQELCCSRFLRDFTPVSIRMAKDQNLALNPQKVSGVCGRLMCCLAYEQTQYKQLRRQMPKIGRLVQTPEGEGRVREIHPLRQVVRVVFADHETPYEKDFFVKELPEYKDLAEAEPLAEKTVFVDTEHDEDTDVPAEIASLEDPQDTDLPTIDRPSSLVKAPSERPERPSSGSHERPPRPSERSERSERPQKERPGSLPLSGRSEQPSQDPPSSSPPSSRLERPPQDRNDRRERRPPRHPEPREARTPRTPPSPQGREPKESKEPREQKESRESKEIPVRRSGSHPSPLLSQPSALLPEPPSTLRKDRPPMRNEQRPLPRQERFSNKEEMPAPPAPVDASLPAAPTLPAPPTASATPTNLRRPSSPPVQRENRAEASRGPRRERDRRPSLPRHETPGHVQMTVPGDPRDPHAPFLGRSPLPPKPKNPAEDGSSSGGHSSHHRPSRDPRNIRDIRDSRELRDTRGGSSPSERPRKLPRQGGLQGSGSSSSQGTAAPRPSGQGDPSHSSSLSKPPSPPARKESSPEGSLSLEQRKEPRERPSPPDRSPSGRGADPASSSSGHRSRERRKPSEPGQE